MCAVGVGRFRLSWLSFLPPFLSAPSLQWMRRGRGQWDSGDVLPSERPLESVFSATRFVPLVPLP